MLDRYKKISVIGLGYIGLPTAALLASKGYIVNGMDVNENAVETINRGEIHIFFSDINFQKSAWWAQIRLRLGSGLF